MKIVLRMLFFLVAGTATLLAVPAMTVALLAYAVSFTIFMLEERRGH